MIIKRNPANTGTFFAIWPRWTPDGWACLEWLNWERIPSWGWGSGDEYRYRRAPKAYSGPTDDPGDRGCFRPRGWRPYPGPQAEFFATPPDPEKNCKNFRTDGPTPCYYPRCTCMIEGGTTCGGGEAVYEA